MKQKYKYFVGTKDQFDKLVEMNKIEDWYIIFISDTHEIYKGVNRYSTDNFMIKTSKPTNPQQNILYSINGELMYYSEEEGWVSLSKAYSLDVPNEDSTDDTIPTSKGVYEAIKEAIENITIDGKGGITNIQSTKAGILTVTKNSIDTEIPLNGVSLKPSYDNDTRTLTIPVMGDDVPFKVSFANDVYIESGYYNELNQTIQLSRSDGEVISIELTGIGSSFNPKLVETDSIELVLDEMQQLSANVKVSGRKDNCLSVEQDGLYVPESHMSIVSF